MDKNINSLKYETNTNKGNALASITRGIALRLKPISNIALQLKIILSYYYMAISNHRAIPYAIDYALSERNTISHNNTKPSFSPPSEGVGEVPFTQLVLTKYKI